MKFKPEFQEALNIDELDVYDDILEKAKDLSFEIYEHNLCKGYREKLTRKSIMRMSFNKNSYKFHPELNFEDIKDSSERDNNEGTFKYHIYLTLAIQK